MEQQAKEYERKLEDAYTELDKSHIRNLMRKTYLCSSDCCNTTIGSPEDVQRCVERCSTPLVSAQTYVKNEFQDFQNRVQRCLMVCSDGVKARMEKEKSTSFSEGYKKDYETCATNCLTNHADSLSSVIDKIKSTLEKQGAGT